MVEIQDTSSKEKETYKIVGSTESDILAETPMISNDCPV
jgi:transcription elongation GreA/GreB family factor